MGSGLGGSVVRWVWYGFFTWFSMVFWVNGGESWWFTGFMVFFFFLVVDLWVARVPMFWCWVAIGMAKLQ